MLRSIQLENFKAFGQRTIIPFAPITLLFGQNSAGKSSVLQSLNLLKQTRESRDVEALLLPRTENGLVDLGSFQELLFDHDLERSLQIRIIADIDQSGRRGPHYPSFLKGTSSLGLEISFSRKSAEDEISLDGFKLCAGDSPRCFASFKSTVVPTSLPGYGPMPVRPERGIKLDRLKAAKCNWIDETTDLWSVPYEQILKSRSRVLSELEKARNKLTHSSNMMLRSLFEDEALKISKADIAERRTALQSGLKSHIEFLSSDFTLRQYVSWMNQQQLGSTVFLDGFIPINYLPGIDDTNIIDILNRVQGRLGLMTRVWMADVGYASVFAGRILERLLTSLFPLGPFRRPPRRWYIFTGTTPQDVGYHGNLLPDLLFRRSRLLEHTNAWLRKLDIGYELLVRRLGGNSSDLFELRLVDTRRKQRVDVGLSDVGFGISQILPLVVQSLAARDQIITIEQPEVHIHPRLQADLGDLLIEAIGEPRRNQFIIETHSEHLALRLQRRVREGVLSPDDISIVYVSRGLNGATAQPLRLDRDGDFIDEFPGGFFPERLRELR